MVEVKKEGSRFCAFIIPMKYMEGFTKVYPLDMAKLDKIWYHYEEYRKSLGKKVSNDYIIVNQDEPYAEDVWQIILAGERKKRGL